MKRKIILLIIMLLLLFILGLTYYKFIYSKEKMSSQALTLKYGFSEPVNISYGIDYFNNFKDDIVFDELKSINYFVTTDDNTIYGRIIIDNNKKLYIIDEKNNNFNLILSNLDFKSLKNAKSDGEMGVHVYALTTDNKLYSITLSDIDLKKVNVVENKIMESISNFTNLKFINYLDYINLDNIVLTNTGKMIDTNTGIHYNSDIINVFNEYYILSDNSILDSKRRMIINSERGQSVKIKLIIIPIDTDDTFKYSPNIIFITEDNRIIYLRDNNYIYDYGKEISNVSYSDDNTFTIRFVDKTQITFSGTYDENIYKNW